MRAKDKERKRLSRQRQREILASSKHFQVKQRARSRSHNPAEISKIEIEETSLPHETIISSYPGSNVVGSRESFSFHHENHLDPLSILNNLCQNQCSSISQPRAPTVNDISNENKSKINHSSQSPLNIENFSLIQKSPNKFYGNINSIVANISDSSELFDTNNASSTVNDVINIEKNGELSLDYLPKIAYGSRGLNSLFESNCQEGGDINHKKKLVEDSSATLYPSKSSGSSHVHISDGTLSFLNINDINREQSSGMKYHSRSHRTASSDVRSCIENDEEEERVQLSKRLENYEFIISDLLDEERKTFGGKIPLIVLREQVFEKARMASFLSKRCEKRKRSETDSIIFDNLKYEKEDFSSSSSSSAVNFQKFNSGVINNQVDLLENDSRLIKTRNLLDVSDSDNIIKSEIELARRRAINAARKRNWRAKQREIKKMENLEKV